MRQFAYCGLLLGVAGLTALYAADDAAAPATTYEVWRPRHEVFKSPYRFSPRVAAATPGTEFRVLQKKASWAKVAFELEGKELTGWTYLIPKRGAGDATEGLGGEIAKGSIALVLKSVIEKFQRFSKAVAEQRPDTEVTFQALQDASLDPAAVETFARTGRLRLPSREVE